MRVDNYGFFAISAEYGYNREVVLIFSQQNPMQSQSLEKTLGKSMAWMSFPIFELVLLRWFQHAFLKLKLGFPGFTDYELLLPAPLAWIAFTLALEQAIPIKFTWSWRRTFLHGFFLGAFLLVNIFYPSLEPKLGLHTLTVWWSVLLLVVLSAFGLFVSLGEVFKNPNRWAIIPCAIMAFSLVLNLKFGAELWTHLLSPLEEMVKHFLMWAGLDQILVMALKKKFLWVQHPQLSILIGQGCSGLDGILFYISAFVIFSCLNWSRFSVQGWMLSFAYGILFFVLLNVLRIVFLFVAGIFCVRYVGAQRGLSWISGIFHVHAGYLFYGLGLAAYFQSLMTVMTWDKKEASQLLKVPRWS
ncbi:hypothetical protein EBR78_05215 [bacterium]|nr:hypothetical protein [bacterium]